MNLLRFVVRRMIEETRENDGRCFETCRRINVLATKNVFFKMKQSDVQSYSLWRVPMIRMLFFLMFFFFLNNPLIVAASPPASDNLPQALRKQVQCLSELLRDHYAVWYPNATRVQFVRLNGGEKLALVVFTVEGFGHGNNHTQYFAVFSPETDEKGRQHFSLIDVMPIAGKAWRGIDTLNAKVAQEPQSDAIVFSIDALEVTSGDSPNFPNKKITITLLLKKDRSFGRGGRLVERYSSPD